MRSRKLKRNLNRASRPPRGKKLPREKLFEPVIETESGTKVRSSYEKICADLFYKNKIRFQYEPLILLGGRQFRPDFFLSDYSLFVEICGYSHQPYYTDRIALKRQLYNKNDVKAVFIVYNGKGSLERIIKERLQPFGIEFRN